MIPIKKFVKKHQVVIIHGFVWLILFLMPIIFTNEMKDGSPRSAREMEFLYLSTILKFFWMGMFYMNTAILIPKLLYKKKWVMFIGAELLIFIGILMIQSAFYNMIITGRPFSFERSIYGNSIPFLLTALSSILYRMVTDRASAEKQLVEKQQENLKTELAFLRSQISPHFLFNVLNNIVALVRLKSQELEPTILKLSSLLQYMLYDTDEEKVRLKSEVDYLQSYVDLQKLRFGDRLTLNVNFDLQEDWHFIEPMLLIPYIENAFKHGTGMIENPTIKISLTVVNNQLVFEVANKYLEQDLAKDKDSGIGLVNVNRRLELLYDKRHKLEINKTEEWFTVTLKIDLEL
ncbi:sensor histidine kinase [Algoriphagus chordae]|uniref:Histidine kinase n=1 Tax=Algoriphagus chordae TaxID=237019 RepID=A0A2W7QJ78_9BACT|nr:histidine kinase [Algoriphagus chordae]PZX48524.1 histidine kinase [Algoriphagus chordae]